MERVRRAPILLLALVVVAAVLVGTVTGALALFTDTFANGSNTFSTDTLDPPTGLTASSTAGAPVEIVLNWTATVDAYASGYRILRGTATGGPYAQIAEVTPRTTTTYTDTTVTSGTTYFYVVRSFYQIWESANSNEASALAQ